MGYTYQKYPKEFCTTRGGPNHRLYMTWYDMIKRCTEGAREQERYYLKGIRVCQEWYDWPVFAAWARTSGYTDELEIDRKDGRGNYEPGNCRFVTEEEQTENIDWEVHHEKKIYIQRERAYDPIVCVERCQRFNSAVEASEVLGVNRPSLSRALHGGRGIVGGFRWMKLDAFLAQKVFNL